MRWIVKQCERTSRFIVLAESFVMERGDVVFHNRDGARMIAISDVEYVKPQDDEFAGVELYDEEA